MAAANTEIEIKLRLASAAAGQHMLQEAGFVVCRERVFESNVVFDTPFHKLRRRRILLRLRQAGPRGTLTYKGRPTVGRHKWREEVDVEIQDSAAMRLLLEALGYRPAFRYEKFRTEFRQPRGPGIATVDETPIGVFLELEGPPEWIDQTARTLGFAESDYITNSYASLYLAHCKKSGTKPGAMAFDRKLPEITKSQR